MAGLDKRKQIENFVKIRGHVLAMDVAKHFAISRQTATFHLRKLIEANKLVKSGSTKNSRYRIGRQRTRATKAVVSRLQLVRKLKGLQEDTVFDEVVNRLNLKKQLNKTVFDIAYYSFCEMLNNAIDHSKSSSVSIDVLVHAGEFQFLIRDAGIGVFKNVQNYFRLRDEFEAAEHLYKGKQTSDPKNHSGQGIFYTSRIADVFKLRSHKLETIIDNRKEDVYFRENNAMKGTAVEFSIKAKSRKVLSQLFQDYANDDFEFDKNSVRVKLSDREKLMSRSQARRLLLGLEKYRRIEFDFNRVTGIGQAFADEIFRVFQNRYPDRQITFVKAGPAVEFMIKRALK